MTHTMHTTTRTLMTHALVRRGAVAVAALVPALLGAQDRRTVTEPAIPPACTTLTAALVARDSTLDPADEARGDTRRIQQALDGCAPGRAVVLAASGAKGAFLTGPLELRAGVTLVVDRGTVLYGSRDPRDYDRTPGSCGVVNQDGKGCRALITGEKVKGAGVMGDGVIDGRGWATLAGQAQSWWDLAQVAKVTSANQNCPRLLQLTRADDFTLYRITLRNAANFHVVYANGDGFTAWAVKILTPRTARNTDGIDPASATNVTIAHSYISTGDDDVAIKAGGAGPTTNVTIAHNHFYFGHGMSIGSETNAGASAIRVTDLSIDGADNGIRIKSDHSRGGLVRDVVYDDVCIRRVKNPIEMDPRYADATDKGLVPLFRDVTLRNVRLLSPGKVTLEGYDAARRLGIALDNVVADSVARTHVIAAHAEITLGPGPVSFRPAGEDVMVTDATRAVGAPTGAAPNACEGKFVPFPTAK